MSHRSKGGISAEFLQRIADTSGKNEIGKIKEQLGLEAYSPKREKEVLENILKHNKGPLNNLALRRLFERIIDESRRLEREAMSERKNSK